MELRDALQELELSAYGIAEATLMVSTTGPGEPASVRHFDRVELGRGFAVPVDADDPACAAGTDSAAPESSGGDDDGGSADPGGSAGAVDEDDGA